MISQFDTAIMAMMAANLKVELTLPANPIYRPSQSQAKYRKLCRQNPSLYKSKKHRSKN